MSFGRNLSNKYRKQLLGTATKAGLDSLGTATKKEIYKATETTAEFIGNKIADKTVKPKPVPNENLRGVNEVIITPEKREQILNEFRQVLSNETL